MAHPVAVTDGTFEDEVLKAETPVLVDFWADWCQPCKMIAPHLDKIADDHEGKLKVAKVNADENPGLVRRYGTLSLPSLLVFVNGVEKGRIVGARPKRRLLGELAEFLPGS